MGLLEDNQEWNQCLEEASIIKIKKQLKALYTIILLQCLLVHSEELWEKFKEICCDDMNY